MESTIKHRVSFDNGKTMIDIMDDSTFGEVVQKLRKAKNWKIIVEAMEPEAMLKATEETKYKGLMVNAEQRVMFLATYLNYAENDLVTKIG